MAVFLLTTLGVVALEPFADVPCSSPFALWIEELARRGITSGCTATTYCPTDRITRAQMAVFLVGAFKLAM
jgi:S-layer homology domain